MRAFALAVTLALSVVPLAAAADPVADARAHYLKGAQHYDTGRYAEAVDEFKLAYELSHRAAILYNIARAETKLGHDQNAIDYLKRYLAEAPNAEDAPSVRAEVEARENALREARARAKAELQAESERQRAEAAARQAEEERKKQRPVPRWPAYAAFGLGGAVLVAGIVFGVVAARTSSQVTSGSGDFDKSLETRGRLAQNLGVTFDVVGAAVLAGGVAWYLWTRPTPIAEKSPPPGAPPRAYLLPAFLPAGGGLVAGGTF